MRRRQPLPRDAFALAQYRVRLLQSPSRSRWGGAFGALKSERLLLLEIERAIMAELAGRARVTPKSQRPRCGAKCRDGHPCRAPAVWDVLANAPRNGRCRMHGGGSTGPRTPEGRARALRNLSQFRPLTPK